MVYVSFVNKAFILIATVISTLVLPRLGPWRTLILGFSVLATGGPLFALTGGAGPYLAGAVGALGTALQAPVGKMYLAAVLQPTDLTRAQTTLGVLGTVAGIIAPAVFTAVFCKWNK